MTCSCIDYIAPTKDKRMNDIRTLLVKAAIRIDDKVYTGWRHAEIWRFMREAGITGTFKIKEEGFIDQDNMFYRRASCAVLASINKQISEPVHVLTSELLWDEDGNPVDTSEK